MGGCAVESDSGISNDDLECANSSASWRREKPL